jgi:hypothetical protein
MLKFTSVIVTKFETIFFAEQLMATSSTICSAQLRNIPLSLGATIFLIANILFPNGHSNA